MGHIYEIQYKEGVNNVAIDAFSILAIIDVFFLAISMVQSDMSSLVKASYALDPLL